MAAACSSSDSEEAVVMPAPQVPSAPTPSNAYLALGDSYTIGQGVAEKERWPVYLANALEQGGIKVGEPRIIARTGWTTADLLYAVKSANLTKNYGLISLMIGVNNQFQGRSLEEFRGQFRELLTISKELAQRNARNVLVLTIPDWGATPFATGSDRAKISEQIQKFNEVIKTEAQAAGSTVIDVYDLSLLVKDAPNLLAPDGLHYSGLMHQRWAERAYPEARKILQD